MRNGKRLALTVSAWLVKILLALAFLLAGLGKLGSEHWAERFASFGYSEGFLYLISGLEVTAGILVLIPALARYGAVMIALIMVGAAVTHLLHDEGHRLVSPAIFFLLASVVFWIHRPLGWGVSTSVTESPL